MNFDFAVDSNVLAVFAGIVGLLVLATAISLGLRKFKPAAHPQDLDARIRSWWIMVAIFALAVLFSRTGAIVFFALLSFLALKEYLSLIPTRRADRRVLFWAYLAIPLQFFWVYDRWYNMFLVFIPVYAFLGLPFRMVLTGETRDFLRAAGTLHWGLMAFVFALSHLAYLLVLPERAGDTFTGPGLLLYLVMLTQLNDVAQYVSGKRFGRRKALPSVSPNKTIEGVLGGVVTTTLLSALVAPLLTPLSMPHAIACGLMISMAGFIGDVTISAVKRDLGLKDTGSLIPGHGGVLDRLDSLVYTAPLYFHFMKYFYY